MSLIKCPECKGTISSTVDSCPHCGYRLSLTEKEAAIADAEINPPKTPSSNTQTQFPNSTNSSVVEDEGSSGGGFALGFLLGIIGLIIAIAIGKKNTKSGAVGGFVLQAIIGLVIWLCFACSGSYYY